MEQGSWTKIMRAIGVLVLIGLVIAEVFLTIRSLHQRNSTGVLQVNSSDKKAAIFLFQPGAQAKKIGVGHSHIRLVAGNYQVVAADSQARDEKTVTMAAGQKTIVSLSPHNLASASQAAGNTEQVNALVQLLPYTGPDSAYLISYSYSFSAGIAKPSILIVSPTAAGTQAAVDWLKSLHFDTSQLPLKYVSGPVSN